MLNSSKLIIFAAPSGAGKSSLIKKIIEISEEKPYNFKPKFSTLFFCCFGLMLFGLGEGLLIVSFTGASPWSVLAQGLSLNVNLSIGMLTFLISVTVLILWIPLGQKPGMATILNALIIALMIDKIGRAHV